MIFWANVFCHANRQMNTIRKFGIIFFASLFHPKSVSLYSHNCFFNHFSKSEHPSVLFIKKAHRLLSERCAWLSGLSCPCRISMCVLIITSFFRCKDNKVYIMAQYPKIGILISIYACDYIANVYKKKYAYSYFFSSSLWQYTNAQYMHDKIQYRILA